MAKCESKDFGLYERFHACEVAYAMDVSMYWPQIRKLLSDRIMYMVYEGNIEKGKMNDGYVMDVFLGGGKSTLGIEVAASLKTMLPFCNYPSNGKQITITDCPDLSKVSEYVKWDGCWIVDPDAKELQQKYVFNSGKVEIHEGLKVATFEDRNFLVILTDTSEGIYMRIFKK
ncbi:MAG: hypothetical protein HFJ51_02900 [Clostridia bacterium]|nr:hypothetical protein [Clostridia bacterium]